MGYNTQFTIDAPACVLEALEQGSFCYDGEYHGKWYSWKEDLRKVSLKYPADLITVEGDGEEGGDLWKAYFLGGACQVAKAEVTFAPFEVTKMDREPKRVDPQKVQELQEVREQVAALEARRLALEAAL